MNQVSSSLLFCLLFALILLGASGCASTDPNNESVRPWNSPIGWENGVPSGMYQQQR
jgi:hypothetical protein